MKLLFKKNQKIIIISILIEFLILILQTSCQSSKIFLPGEKEVTTKNIYNEYLSIAENYYKQENFDKAIEYYNVCLSNKENYWSIYYKLARSYAMQEKWSEAEEMYQKLLLRDNENSNIKASLAYIYSKNGELDKAKNLYSELMAMYPEKSEYLENTISILILEGDCDQISVPLYLLIETFPDSSKIKTFQNEYDKLIEKKKKEQIENSKIPDIVSKIENEPIEILDDKVDSLEENDIVKDILNLEESNEQIEEKNDSKTDSSDNKKTE